MSKKPDNVVYSDENGYYANILPYGTNVGAPVIKLDDVVTWKAKGIHNVNKELESKFNELKDEYNKLVEEYKWNELVYSSKFSFEPVVGETYFMYIGKDGKEFLSLISPKEWDLEYIGTFLLNSQRKWVLLEKNSNIS